MADKAQSDAVTTVTVADSMATTTSIDQPTIVAATESLDLEAPVVTEKELASPSTGELPATEEKSPDSTQLDKSCIKKEKSSDATKLDETRVEEKESSDTAKLDKTGGTEKKVLKPATIEDLPNELLSQIFGLLDIVRPSESLLDEPTFDLTDAETADLKASSCVSKRWRQAIVPILFKHSRFVVEEAGPKIAIRSLSKEMQPFEDFVNKNALLMTIITFVLVVKDRTIAGDDDVPEHKLDWFAKFWRQLFNTIDPVEVLIVAHPEILGAFTSCRVYDADIWNFDCPCHYLRLQRPSTPQSQPAVTEKGAAPKEAPKTDEAHEVIEPATSTVSKDGPVAETADAGSGGAEGSANSVPETSSSSQRDSFGRELEPWQILHPQSSTLFKIRPWSSLLLNEGSFIKAYSTYEFWLRQAPSILSDMVGADDQPSGSLLCDTIREMAYIGIFPMASHFSSLTRHLPRLNTLYVQLVPRNNILDVKSKMVQVEQEDLWMERNSCYALLMRELFNAPPVNNYKYLEIFESGDAADTDAWHMAVEYVKRAGNGWKVAGDGVFVRDAKDLAPEPEEGAEAGDPSSLQVVNQ